MRKETSKRLSAGLLASAIVLNTVLSISADDGNNYHSAGESGIQEFMSFYCKAPMHRDGERPVHDLFKQFAMLKNKIRELGGYEPDQELD